MKLLPHLLLALALAAPAALSAQTMPTQKPTPPEPAHRFDPPWNAPFQAGVPFTVPGIDNAPDLYGDVVDPQLVVFFGGNQFMVLDDLLKEFRKAHPEYVRIFVETLPPGILAQQIAQGSLVLGNMRIELKPDVYAAGKNRMDMTPEWFARTTSYAQNRLAILVRQGNPKKVTSLRDLGRPEVRVSMPNPEWEGIGKRIEESYEKAGGAALKTAVMTTKVKAGSTYLTQIHHRQSPLRVLYDQSDAAPVWYTEAFYQKMLGHPVETVAIPAKENILANYVAGVMKAAPHAKAAEDFVAFLNSPAGQAVYQKYGFLPPVK
ncbi:ABC-type molybdate transport system substrate-binding protein [Hymenobacter luteus]|uniref:ABC transporter substrate-binding protein n=3 Tax=Hymenobacter TaxID=89966 RepID=A0A3R9U7N4_9BACT|nr:MULTISPECIES: substrate-binding domain-containing protein [Hymenobacter]MBB4603644.1 ABC-type molybdate transport system substrate-binding protein [Hymenobacter latericoloratus]MBB6061391.1 ABC-type molybdate transport system substrate-binding protein [Hymenobacter luteus]RSK25031.1 ABC transporter substrate-binding protein [Hymenobacter metallilatus]